MNPRVGAGLSGQNVRHPSPCMVGWRQSLAWLARIVEPEIPDGSGALPHVEPHVTRERTVAA